MGRLVSILNCPEREQRSKGGKEAGQSYKGLEGKQRRKNTENNEREKNHERKITDNVGTYWVNGLTENWR